jgi:hypothetical protein
MPTNAHVAFSMRIPAAPPRIWRILTDYRVHHPAILPPHIFRKLEVLSGGMGAGTRFRLTMRLGGKDHITDLSVTEPRPGHTLIERADDGSAETRFLLEPTDAGQATLLTFDTDYTLPGGFFLPLQRWVTNNILRGLFRQEMTLLTKYVADDRDLKQGE